MEDKKFNEHLAVAKLFFKSLLLDLSEKEKIKLKAWKNSSQSNRALSNRIEDGKTLANDLLEIESLDVKAATQRIFSQTGMHYTVGASKKSPDVFSYRTFWKVAAACLILGFSAAVWLYLERSKSLSNPLDKSLNAKIVPGVNKAILTLSDGSQVLLDSSTSGLIGTEGNTQVFMLNGKNLSYTATLNGAAAKPVYNTLTTPRGGQYQLTLPDGTAVWLNSASSITFPTSFDGADRVVKITGETYFEVKSIKDQTNIGKKPFIVEVGTERITVLGTHFNINAYGDDYPVKTTLVEGSVKVSNDKGFVVIQPGEQTIFQYSNTAYKVIKPNLEEVLAWKNGKFIFSEASARSIMLQLSRWYDVDIVFESDLNGINFSGGLSRKDQIEKLIELLALDGRIKLSLKGRKLYVSRNE